MSWLRLAGERLQMQPDAGEGDRARAYRRQAAHGEERPGGKTVTVVYDLPNNETFLKIFAQELKRACGTGGAVADNTVELQGDLRDRVRDYLTKKGFTVKG